MFEQLLSNILDPNLIINTGYQLQTVTMQDGRVVSGMIEEETNQRLVLKMIGGQEEILAKDQIENVETSPVSFMPEGLEQTMSEEDMVHLLAYLSLTAPPDDPNATLIPGAPVVTGIDPDRIHLPETVENLLMNAQLESNVAEYGQDQLRGAIGNMIWDPTRGSFRSDSQWHEYGVAHGEILGVVPEQEAVYWQAEWDEPVQANLIVLSGTYDNQPQPDTAWKIELRHNDVWTSHDSGVAGWFDRGRYVWGDAGGPPLAFDAIRVSVFSKDHQSSIKSIHFRGEPDVSWVVADVPEDVSVEQR